ncbi:unnamed protein product [Sphagnum jensenii]|uniref:HMA domain-containing protein n=1 Tax=Sphagnum jensenii TaxID=128206 RepID=A0ABP1BZ29_9BRYO
MGHDMETKFGTICQVFMSALSTNSSTIVVFVPFHKANRVSITVEVKTVVLKVVMHCEGCASSVKRAVARIPGVTSYTIDFPVQKVTVIGNVKPDEVLRRVAKTGKHATFWPQEPPVPKEEEQKKEKQENESDAKAADDDTNKEGKNEEKPKEEITVMLRVAMHCEACVDTVRRAVVRIPGVISSTVDFMAQKVTVVGNVTREEVFKRVSRTGKQTAFWPEEPKEEKEEKKEEKEEEKKEEKKEEETKEKTKEEPEKEESKDEKKEEAATAKEENKDKATTQVEERKEPFLVFEELYPVSFALRPDYTRYYYY